MMDSEEECRTQRERKSGWVTVLALSIRPGAGSQAYLLLPRNGPMPTKKNCDSGAHELWREVEGTGLI